MRYHAHVTTCNPGDNLNTIANAGSDGDTFLLTAGTYNNQKVLPKHGQTFIGAPGVILDGGDTTDYCFYYDDGIRHPMGVTLQSFTVQNYTGGSGRGAIFGANSLGWTLDQLFITGTSAGRGVDAGKGMRLRSCVISESYMEGLNGYLADNLLIEDCEFFNNNTSQNNPDTVDGFGSGMKLATCVGVKIRNTYSHDNYGVGMWLDIDCHDVQFFNCSTARNTHRGFHVEISDTVQVLNCTCIEDGVGTPLPGGCGVFVSTSSNVEVAGCRFFKCVAISEYNDTSRGTGDYGLREIRNFNYHDNTWVGR